MTADQTSGEFNEIDYEDSMVVRILDAAEQCIERYGIRRTSMGEVARFGKLSRGSIYRHFGDKGSLIEGVFQRRRLAYLNREEATLERLPTLLDKLVHAIVEGRKTQQDGIFSALAETEPETVAMMMVDAATYRRSVAFWPPHIRLAQSSGEIRSDIAVDTVVDIIMRLAVSLTMFPDMGKSLSTDAEIRHYLDQVLLRGLQ